MASKDKVSEKVQEAIFTQILNRSGNGECADCNNRSPTWVSLDFGVFICIRCSGVHRQIGPHITRVRSTKLDGWTKENIEIMSTIGNNLANDFYEYRMPTGYRKPGPNSSPEECKRFVDEKYIKKVFAPAGYQEPVKELIASKAKGAKPNFGFCKEQQNKSKPEPAQTEPSNVEAESGLKFMRKKSMSLDKLPEVHSNVAHQQDLLSPDDDLLGFQAENNELATHSASPMKKINFASFKKAQAQNATQPVVQNPMQQNLLDIGSIEPQQNQPNPTLTNQFQSQDQQKQTENKVDLMKLYSQPQGVQHQNHFMQGLQQQGWNYGWNQGYNAGHHLGPQNNYHVGQANNFYGQQPNMGHNPYMNYAGGMGTGMSMNYGQGPVQSQYGANAYPNNGFVQTNVNKFF